MKKKIVLLIISFIASFCCIGQKFGEVFLGNQIWMTENLNSVKFRNGDSIPEARSDAEWLYAGKNKQPAWCYYDGDTTYDKMYGKLYNWFAVNDPRGLAPEGWHIPSLNEWDSLQNYLGADAGKKMRNKSNWKMGGNGSNESGFSGLPGGIRYYTGSFSYRGYAGAWWSSDEPTSVKGTWGRGLVFYDNKILKGYDGRKDAGLSVRCVKDSPITPK